MQRAMALAVLVTLSVVCQVNAALALTFTCSTVARRAQTDPVGAVFKSRFDSPAINGQGDVAFVAYPSGAPRRLYLYPAGGGASVVAEQGGLAPGGATFKHFKTVSINDGAALAFHATITGGSGVFVGPAGGLAKAAMTGDTSPAGGAFDKFPAVSRVNSVGDVAFAATAVGGPNGVFLYDASLTTVLTVGLASDAALDGRQLCEFLDVGLGASGAVAVRAATKLDCSDAGEPELIGIYAKGLLAFQRIALEGDPAPSPATTYAQFIAAPDVNAADKVMFRARTEGGDPGIDIFLHDPAGPSTVRVVGTGDVAPSDGGELRTIAPAGLTDGDRVAIGARLGGGSAKTGIFLFDTTPDDEKVVASSDDPPTDAFGPNSLYTKINPGNRKNNEGIGVDRSGTQVAYTAKVKDTLGTLNASGVLRCEGS